VRWRIALGSRHRLGKLESVKERKEARGEEKEVEEERRREGGGGWNGMRLQLQELRGVRSDKRRCE